MSAPPPGLRAPRRAAASLIAVAAMTTVPAFATSAAGEPTPNAPRDKGAPAEAAPPAPAGPVCDLNEHGHGKDEFAHCTEVDVSFASTPDVGSTTTVDVSVTAVDEIENGTLTLLVNDAFDLVGSDGFADAGTKASGVGRMTAVSRSISLDADDTETFSIEVSGDRAGIGVVQARFRTAGGAFDGGDEASAQLGATESVSPRGLATVKAPANARTASATEGTATYRPAKVRGAKSLSPSAPGASCATGRWVFNDETGAQNRSVNFQVKVWDQDSSSGDDVLAIGVTNFSGDYNLCFESTDGEGGGQEVYVQFISHVAQWRVRNTAASNQDYVFSTGVQNLADPGTANFGALQPSDPALHRALHAFDGLNRLWLWQPNAYMDDPGQTRQMVLNWTATSTDGTYYSLGGNDIHLAAADPDADHTTIHEGAHALMDALYDDAFPSAPNCNPHSIFGPSSTGCAWTEGWAEWVPARVLNDPFYRWPDGASLNLESPSWGSFTGAYGDTSEGRIAGALIDLSDSDNEGYWDRYSEGGSSAASEEIYATSVEDVSGTLNEFFNTDRPDDGNTGYFARASVFQNTVDYTHRDPLVSQEELTRPSLTSAPNPHNYSYTSSSAYWGGVAIRPPASSDYDLRLFGNEALTTLLDTSAAGTGGVDYVLVDGNHRTGTFYPQAFLFGGSGGSYQVEQFTGGTSVGTGATAGSFGSGDVIRPFDAFVTGGQTNYIRVVPSGSLDVAVFAHDSDGSADDAVQDRFEADASGNSGGAGAAESLTYSSADSDWTGLAIVNNGGSGSFTVYRDVAGPSAPTVVIDGGATGTYDDNVNLALSATAGATAVTEVQISTDGVFDSEAWQPYSASKSITLPAGFGTKTVTVRYRNAAGAISANASDTIARVATPTCNGLTATVAGFGKVTGTGGNDVIVGSVDNDTINGFGGNDVICGLGGNDTISDGAGADQVFGGNGDDVINQLSTVDAGDVLDGGAGIDRVGYQNRTGALTIKIDANAGDGAAGENDRVTTSIENVTGGAGADSITGGAAGNVLVGGNGNDHLVGAGGADSLLGGGGNDSHNSRDGVGGNDTVNGGPGTDTAITDPGDTVVSVP